MSADTVSLLRSLIWVGGLLIAVPMRSGFWIWKIYMPCAMRGKWR